MIRAHGAAALINSPGVTGDGIISGVSIENNVIFGNAQNGVNMDGVQNTLLRNNLIYGNARNAVRACNIDGAAGPMNLRIVNKHSARAATPQPSVTLAALPTTVTSGSASTLTWSSTNATSCVASGGWSGVKKTLGLQSITAITTATNYVLACTGPGGTTTQSVTVVIG